MPTCVDCGKTIEMGYTVIENKIYCPECAEKHPLVIEANKRREQEEIAMDIMAEAMWALASGGKSVKKLGPKGKELTKEEFKEVVKARRLVFR
jgi:predicted RNA-binding Zn-ribbon protein involved in translation (DUF1610 family)